MWEKKLHLWQLQSNRNWFEWMFQLIRISNLIQERFYWIMVRSNERLVIDVWEHRHHHLWKQTTKKKIQHSCLRTWSRKQLAQCLSRVWRLVEVSFLSSLAYKEMRCWNMVLYLAVHAIGYTAVAWNAVSKVLLCRYLKVGEKEKIRINNQSSTSLPPSNNCA